MAAEVGVAAAAAPAAEEEEVSRVPRAVGHRAPVPRARRARVRPATRARPEEARVSPAAPFPGRRRGHLPETCPAHPRAVFPGPRRARLHDPRNFRPPAHRVRAQAGCRHRLPRAQRVVRVVIGRHLETAPRSFRPACVPAPARPHAPAVWIVRVVARLPVPAVWIAPVQARAHAPAVRIVPARVRSLVPVEWIVPVVVHPTARAPVMGISSESAEVPAVREIGPALYPLTGRAREIVRVPATISPAWEMSRALAVVTAADLAVVIAAASATAAPRNGRRNALTGASARKTATRTGTSAWTNAASP